MNHRSKTKLRFTTQTLTGKGGRAANEDTIRSASVREYSCWVVADGLGGHARGAQASQVAANAVIDAFQQWPEASASALSGYFEAARQALDRRRQQEPDARQMRTTLVVLVSDGENAIWAHLGDSRLYWFRGGVIHYQTRDHSVPQALADAGQIMPGQIRGHEDRNRLLRSLSGKEDPRPTMLEAPRRLAPGDAFLLCSDGFWEYVPETAMEFDLLKSASAAEWLFHMELRLRASQPQDCDNYSAVAITAAAGEGASE